ncbi:hypothetical protein N658DRAFT_145610 [Parathielavia hyrcaniae]|uniref:GPI anchored serine-threonine rich protein n=1 Tax=Parathielavia hyrcaniae TaxID=113614 RepID=A0AAN6PYA7_9PEZI|nr:hypothetical protein N658DRAFT_145610 [Parathielavia hyrcaniae]
MKAILLPLAVLASCAMAQSTSVCAANYIVEACLEFENAKLNECGQENWDCSCQQWQNIITCYNNCPNDPRQHAAEGQRVIFCGYASQYPSSTPTVQQSAAATTTAQSAQETNESATTGTGSQSGTATSTGSDAVNTNSAAYLALNAGAVLAAVAGVVAVVL